MRNVKLKCYICAFSVIYTFVSAMPIDELKSTTGSSNLLSSNYSNTFFSKNFENNASRTGEFSIVKLPVDAEADTLVVAERDESEKLDPGGLDHEKVEEVVLDHKKIEQAVSDQVPLNPSGTDTSLDGLTHDKRDSSGLGNVKLDQNKPDQTLDQDRSKNEKIGKIGDPDVSDHEHQSQGGSKHEKLDPGGSDREKHSPEVAEAIIDAEHDRDVAMAKNKNTKEVPVLEISDDDVDAFRKQLNISSPMLDDIMDAETGRDETLTDIMLRPEWDSPQFAFLAAPPEDASLPADIAGVNNDMSGVDGATSSGNNERAGLDTAVPEVARSKMGLDSDRPVMESSKKILDGVRKGVNNATGVEYVELVEAARAGDNSSTYRLGNVTGHELEDDRPPDTRFTDVQTLFLACFGTLLPLLLALLALLLARWVVRRWCPRCCGARVALSSASVASDDKPDQLNEEYKPESEPGGGGGDAGGLPPPATNGSIITMTLKNNHLIVETEERNDITQNSRETKMKYSPDNDGIFVVEVQQSAPYRPINKSHSPIRATQISSNQHALVHRAPEDEILEAEDFQNKRSIDKDKSLALSNTGLSISDLSMSSVGSHNPSYSYGSQTGYEQGPFGYPVYPGYDVPNDPSVSEEMSHDNSREPLLSKTPTDPDKPVVTAAIFKQDSIIGNDILQGPGYCIEGSTDGPLLSDVQAREVSLHQLHDKMDKKMENGQVERDKELGEHSPKKHFNRADSLPPRLEEDRSIFNADDQSLETIGEDEEKTLKDVNKGKRASLPTITTEVYESVKDSLIPSASPRFEKLTNASSPDDSQLSHIEPPLITITEEHDNPAFQNEVESAAS